MKRIVVACLIAVQFSGVVGAEPLAGQVQPPALAPTVRSTVSDDAIKEAVRRTLAETRENPRRHEVDTLRANKYEVFSQEFSEAKVPDCLHPDGLKRQPPVIGPVAFVGLFAVPFVVLAKVRGKCL